VQGGAEQGFIRTPNGTATPIDVPQGLSTYPTSIDAAGFITGLYAYNDGTAGFFRGSRTGTLTTFQAPLASATNPMSINDSGDIAGYYVDVEGVAHGFLVTP
jgi:hypothetical protein